MTKISIYSNDLQNDYQIIQDLKKFFCHSEDFNIFTDREFYNLMDSSVLLGYYMSSYSGHVIFLNWYDYETHKDELQNEAYLFLDLTGALAAKLNKQNLKNHKILTYNNDKKIEWVSNEI